MAKTNPRIQEAEQPQIGINPKKSTIRHINIKLLKVKDKKLLKELDTNNTLSIREKQFEDRRFPGKLAGSGIFQVVKELSIKILSPQISLQK